MKRVPEAGIIGRVALREAATSELNQMMGLVRAALQARYDAASKTGAPYSGWFDIEAMYADRVIVCKDGRYWQFDYTIDDTNAVKLGEPKEVIEQFLPVALKEALQPGGPGPEAVFIESVDQVGSAYDAVLVRAGLARNAAKTYYPDAALREAAPVFEGARVFVKSDAEHLAERGKDVRNIAGWISGARFVEGRTPDTGYVAGRVNLTAGELRDKIADAWKRGKKDLVALSIDATGSAKAALREAALGAKRVVRSITKVNSVDLIVDASAGGALVSLIEAADTEEQDPMKQKMLAAITAKFPQLDVAALTDDQVLARYTEAMSPAAPAAGSEPVTREDLRMVEARAHARSAIAACGLPKPACERLQKRFDGLARFAEADVDTEIKAEREYLARMTESGSVNLGGLGNDISVEDRSKKIAGMFDAFFNPDGKDAEGKAYPRVVSFKECYIEATGDRRITGRLENMDRTRLAESLGAAFRESLDTSALSDVLGSAIRRRLIADYRENTQWDCWRLACERVPVVDFRTNERTRIGGYGNLSDVAEGSAYLALASPTDEKATYAATKRGGTEDLTLEAIKNDDVSVIRRIPVGLARSAKRTLCEFTLDFVRTNPTLYDSVAFFHATHANLGSAALDAASLSAARLRMKKQTELSSGKRLGVGPKYIWTPDDLEQTAVDLFKLGTSNDKNFLQSLSLQVIPVPYWTDANDWAISADPTDVPGIEIGFLDGNEEPELFVQDNPTVGSMFSNDKLTWKIRHIYGGNVKDFRGWDKSVVT